MAASYAAKTAESLSGLVLLGAYSSKDLTQSGLPVLSITAELDTVVDENKMERNRENLPEDTLEKTIAGGNHSGFGDYGLQEKDTQATITAAQQQARTDRAAVRGGQAAEVTRVRRAAQQPALRD